MIVGRYFYALYIDCYMNDSEKKSPENSGDDDSSEDDYHYFPAGSTNFDALCELWTVIESYQEDIGNKKCENRDLMEKIQERLTMRDKTITDMRRQLDVAESELETVRNEYEQLKKNNNPPPDWNHKLKSTHTVVNGEELEQLKVENERLQHNLGAMEEENMYLKQLLCEKTGTSIPPTCAELKKRFDDAQRCYLNATKQDKYRLEQELERARNDYFGHPEKAEAERREKEQRLQKWHNDNEKRLHHAYIALAQLNQKCLTLTPLQKQQMKRINIIFTERLVAKLSLNDFTTLFKSATDLREYCAILWKVLSLDFTGTGNAMEKKEALDQFRKELEVMIEEDKQGFLPERKKLNPVWKKKEASPSKEPVRPRVALKIDGKALMAELKRTALKRPTWV